MSAPATITHLMKGQDNGDGTVTVQSVISLCCRVAFPGGLGTLDPDAVTCPKFNMEGTD